MGVEQDIKTGNFRNEWQKLRANLLFSANWLNNEIKEFLLPFAITPKQFNILRILRGHTKEMPLSILDIREKMIDKMSDASRIIDRLHKKELIIKKPCTMDKRTTRILITKTGLQLLKKIDRKLPKLDTATKKGLNEKEAQQLNQLLERLRE